MSKCDMLVKLYELPMENSYLQKQLEKGILIRKPIAPEIQKIVAWANDTFSPLWGSEILKAISNNPVSGYIAIKDKEIIGFSCYDATAKGFFGPTGVSESCRGLGTGHALLMVALQDMRNVGYGYAVIGGAGPVEFYAKAVGAIVIPDSEHSIYKTLLH